MLNKWDCIPILMAKMGLISHFYVWLATAMAMVRGTECHRPPNYVFMRVKVGNAN